MNMFWIGRHFGIPGSLLIVSSFAYSLRKRKIVQRGSPKFLLDVHECLSWTGALMILVHAGIHFNALLPWAAIVMMLIVIASGFTGKVLLNDAKAMLKSRTDVLRKRGVKDEELEKILHVDSLTVDAMKKWRSVHIPITTIFGALAVLHILSILVFWRW